MNELTKAEEQVMHILWKLEKAYLKDIAEAYEDPKPAYTTISTVIRVLVKKGFIAYNQYGKVHEYYPLISKSRYFKRHLGNLVHNFFNGSATNFASFFTQQDDLNLEELEEIKKMIESRIQSKKDEKNE